MICMSAQFAHHCQHSVPCEKRNRTHVSSCAPRFDRVTAFGCRVLPCVVSRRQWHTHSFFFVFVYYLSVCCLSPSSSISHRYSDDEDAAHVVAQVPAAFQSSSVVESPAPSLTLDEKKKRARKEALARVRIRPIFACSHWNFQNRISCSALVLLCGALKTCTGSERMNGCARSLCLGLYIHRTSLVQA